MKSETERRGDALAQLNRLGRVSIPNAALLIGLHPHTLRKYVREREIAYLLIGERPWITAEEIERFRKEGRLDPIRPVSEEANSEWAKHLRDVSSWPTLPFQDEMSQNHDP